MVFLKQYLKEINKRLQNGVVLAGINNVNPLYVFIALEGISVVVNEQY